MKTLKQTYLKVIAALSAIILAAGIILVCIFFCTQDEITHYINLPFYSLPEENALIVDDCADYLGQPDMIKTKTGKLITVYPLSHGKGALKMQYSYDGVNWIEQPTPASWESSQEVPTLYTLDFTDGSQKLILISGKPYWPGIKADGFQYSISSDDGNTWSEFTTVYSPMDCIVAMSSLIQLKVDGNYTNQWLGTFHTHDFVNYKTILSFDESGNAVWSQPQPILSEHRSIEKQNSLCEIELLRAPNDTIIMLTRNESRNGKTSMICYSYDECRTWTQPQYLPADFSGDRFQALYDENSNKVVISYRQIVPFKENALSLKKFMTYGWVAWIGDFEDLLNYQQGTNIGDCLLLLGSDTSGDCGYSGIVNFQNQILAIAYGNFNGYQIRLAKFDVSETSEFDKILN